MALAGVAQLFECNPKKRWKAGTSFRKGVGNRLVYLNWALFQSDDNHVGIPAPYMF